MNIGTNPFIRNGLRGIAVVLIAALPGAAIAQGTALSERARAMDANGNGVIDRNEARGPLADNFDTADTDKSGSLDGAEIRNFFRGGGAAGGAPPATQAATGGGDKALSGRAKNMDANGNGVIDRNEARGPLADNFDKADTDKSGTLDGAEIRAFFQSRGGGRGGRAATVTLDQVIKGRVTETVPVYGRLVARQMGVVAARARGAVAVIRADVGDRVKLGDPLAVLTTDMLKAERDLKAAELNEYNSRVSAAEAQLALARQELARLERLRKSAAFSQARYEDKRQDVARLQSTLGEARAKVQQARAELRMTDINLVNAVIRAPFGGVVSQRHIDVGAYVNVGQQVVTLIDDESLEVEAEVPSARLGGLTDGTVVRVEFEDKTPFDAAVRAVVPEENPLSRTRTVRFTADFGGNGAHAAVNQSVRLLIPAGPARDVVSVHKDAVLQRGGQTIVYVVENDQAAVRPVKLGEAVGQRFVVLDGLRPGEMVVVRGNERLRPGQNVQIRAGGPA